MLEAKPLTFLRKHWNCLKWGVTNLAVFRHHVFSFHHLHRHHISIVFPPPLPPHFYCFLSTTTATTTFLLFSLHHYHHHHTSIVFPPPPPHFYCCYPSPSRFILFVSTRFYKRLPTAILSSFCSNVSCSKQQSWFSSAISCLPCLSAPVFLKTATPQLLYALVQVLYNILMGHIPIL